MTSPALFTSVCSSHGLRAAVVASPLAFNLGAFPTLLTSHFSLNSAPKPSLSRLGLSTFPWQPQHFTSVLDKLPLPEVDDVSLLIAGQCVISTSEEMSFRLDVKSHLERALYGVEGHRLGEPSRKHSDSLQCTALSNVTFSSQCHKFTYSAAFESIELSSRRFPSVFIAAWGLALPLSFLLPVSRPHFLPNPAHFVSTPTTYNTRPPQQQQQPQHMKPSP